MWLPSKPKVNDGFHLENIIEFLITYTSMLPKVCYSNKLLWNKITYNSLLEWARLPNVLTSSKRKWEKCFVNVSIDSLSK